MVGKETRVREDIRIEKGRASDIDSLEVLYDELNDYLETHVNHPGWAKGIYPVRETAATGIGKGTLFVARVGEAVAGTIILNHEPEEAYGQVRWLTASDYRRILVIHTLAVHPEFMGMGVGGHLMEFARIHAEVQGMVSIRLDVHEGNAPAIALYERSGYKYVGTVDLGLGIPRLKWFRIYELVL